MIVVGSSTRNTVLPPSTGLFLMRLDAVVREAKKEWSRKMEQLMRNVHIMQSSNSTLLLWVVCDSKYQPFCFVSLYLIIFFFSFFSFELLGNGSRKRLLIVAKLQQIFNFCQNFASFSIFSWFGGKHTLSDFSKSIQLIREMIMISNNTQV